MSLSDVLGDAARAIHDRLQAPVAIAAQSVLRRRAAGRTGVCRLCGMVSPKVDIII
jgi:hypothetical protein